MKETPKPTVATVTESDKPTQAEMDRLDLEHEKKQDEEPSPYRESLERDKQADIAEAREILGIDALEVRIAELEKNQAKFRR